MGAHGRQMTPDVPKRRGEACNLWSSSHTARVKRDIKVGNGLLLRSSPCCRRCWSSAVGLVGSDRVAGDWRGGGVLVLAATGLARGDDS